VTGPCELGLAAEAVVGRGRVPSACFRCRYTQQRQRPPAMSLVQASAAAHLTPLVSPALRSATSPASRSR
jgi:hypothetical protein